MEPSDVNVIVDNLANKIGVAAEKMQPIAEEMVQEVVRSNMVFVYSCVAVFLVALLLSWTHCYICFRCAKKTSDEDTQTAWEVGGVIPAAIVMLIATIACSVNAVTHLADALKPTIIVAEKFLR